MRKRIHKVRLQRNRKPVLRTGSLLNPASLACANARAVRVLKCWCSLHSYLHPPVFDLMCVSCPLSCMQRKCKLDGCSSTVAILRLAVLHLGHLSPRDARKACISYRLSVFS
jgi:hypothetical protein